MRTYKSFFQILIIIFTVVTLSACQTQRPKQTPHINVIASGFFNPVGMAILPDGSLLIAEGGTGMDDNSAGISLITPDGEIGRLISGLQSLPGPGEFSGSPLIAISPDHQMLYVGNFGTGNLWTFPLPQNEPLTLPLEPYRLDQMGMAMQQLNNVKIGNPFDITFNANNAPIVTDASGNGLAKETPDGATEFIHLFSGLVNPDNENLMIDPVPTGITRVQSEYFVTLSGGCPYPNGSGELVAVGENQEQRLLVDDLNMPIDVAQSIDGTIWVLEHATYEPNGACFEEIEYEPNTGTLSKIGDAGSLERIVTKLNYPGAILPLADGSLLVSEVRNGRILHITFEDNGTRNDTEERGFEIEVGEPVYQEISDVDGALTAVIKHHNLTPNPGADLREGDTPLAQLGQMLFFDPILSGDQNTACATCHHPAFAMADGRVLPIGAGGTQLGPQRTFDTTVPIAPDAHPKAHEDGETIVPNPFFDEFVPRNSPTILNAALLDVQFWDGRVANYATTQVVTTPDEEVNVFGMTDALAAQALFPITSPHEMAGASLSDFRPENIRELLIARVQAIPAYQEMFQDVFGTEEVTAVRLAEAIAAFERRFIFTNSPWDAYLSGETDALTEQQKRGALLFFGELNTAVNCVQCHNGDLFTDLDFHNILSPQLGPGKDIGEDEREDWGRSHATFEHRDQFKFRTPGLRNVALTAPYFHSGAYPTLESAIQHHANIWESAATYNPNEHLPTVYIESVMPFAPDQQAHSVAPQLRDGMPLSQQDIADLTAFIHALTDPEATNLMAFLPESVPSGLPLDPLPAP